MKIKEGNYNSEENHADFGEVALLRTGLVSMGWGDIGQAAAFR